MNADLNIDTSQNASIFEVLIGNAVPDGFFLKLITSLVLLT